MLDGVMEHVMDGVCDGVWLFGKDSFEECPLTSLFFNDLESTWFPLEHWLLILLHTAYFHFRHLNTASMLRQMHGYGVPMQVAGMGTTRSGYG